MTAEPPFVLDELDQKIITCLIHNGRMSNRDIAREALVSEGTVRYRLNRLMENNIMKIAAVVNPLKVGLNVSVQIGLKVDAGKVEEVAHQLSLRNETKYVGITVGAFDIIIECVFNSNDHMLSFFTHQLSKLEGVRQTETFLFVRHVKSIYHWELPNIEEQDLAFGIL
jgi:Lrp/AsnC family transcriptional regulator, regulator for asnA, asnC and gidA